MTITIAKHHVIGMILLVAGMIVLPDGPWYRELPGILLILLGTKVYDGHFPR